MGSCTGRSTGNAWKSALRQPSKLGLRLLGACAATFTSACIALTGTAAAAAQPHGLGLIPTPSPQATPAVIARSNLRAATLPASVSLTQYAMPVGNQGQVGSCAAWSSDYGALGYWENKEGITGGGLEPMYTYSQVDGGADNGSTIEGNLQVDETQGIDTQSDYWQGNFDFTDQPTAAEKLNAVNWKLSSYGDLSIDQSTTATVTQASIETALAAGDPVVIGIPVYDNFYDVGTANNGLYSSIAGAFEGYHAIAALGYNSQGLVIENSWGTGWGDAGFATLAWSFVNDDVFDAVKVGPLVSTRPASSAVPTISGSVRVGQTLTATPGTWTATPSTYSYQWESAASGSTHWATISGATAASYVVASSLLGDDLRVVVTATGTTGSGASASVATAAVGAALSVPVAAVAPAVSGTAAVGHVLSATSGTWTLSPTKYTYQWQRSANSGGTWASITGATAATYTPTSADAGDEERVVVTATNATGAGTANSAAVGPVLSAPVNVTAPVVSGTARAGQALSVSAGTWNTTASSFTYQWQRSGAGGTWASIGGATASTYVAQAADVGAALHAIVCASNGAGTTCATSTASAAVTSGAPVAASLPVISGTAVRGQTLSATMGTWSPAATAYSEQWQRSTNAGGSWTSISGATAATYTAVKADEGAVLRVIVTARNSLGSAAAASAATAAVRASLPTIAVLPKLSGTAAVGAKLTASTGTWGGAGDSYSYQWQRSSGGAWSNISGATSSSFTVTSAYPGYWLRVIVKATNVDGSLSESSAASGKVAKPALAARLKTRKASRKGHGR